MAQLTNILSSSWPASGIANAASVGVSSLTGAWSFGEDVSVPVGNPGRNYFINDVSGSTGSIKINSSAVPFVGTSDYWIRFWAKFETVDENLYPANGAEKRVHTISSSGTKLLTTFNFRPGTHPGYTTHISEFLSNASLREINDVGSTLSAMTLPLDEWVELAWHFSRDSTEGRYAFYINGVCIGEMYSADTENEISLSDSQGDWSMSFPSATGMKIKVSGPIESWSDVDIPLRPLHDRVPINSYITQRLFHHWNESVLEQGVFWRISGTATIASIPLATGGLNPRRNRLAMSGISGDTFDVTSIDNVGTLPFNEYGDATIVLTDFYLPGSTRPALNINLKNSTNTANVVSLTIDNTGTLRQGTTILKTGIASNVRYALNIHLSNTGIISWSLVDLTNEFGNQIVFSGPLDNWTPQDIGAIQFTGTIGDAQMEIGSVNVCKWVEASLVDSLSAGNVNALVPTMEWTNHIASRFYSLYDAQSIPGGSYSKKNEWTAHGFGRRGISLVMARGGNTRSAFTNVTINTGGGFDYVRGMILYNFDGGSVNDLDLVTDEVTRDSVVSQLKTNVETMIDKLAANNNKIWLTTMVPRDIDQTNPVTWNEFQIQAMKLFNAQIRKLAPLKQTPDNLVEFSDVVSYIDDTDDYFDGNDSIHFTSFGDGDYSDLMVQKLMIPVNPIPVTPGTIMPTVGNIHITTGSVGITFTGIATKDDVGTLYNIDEEIDKIEFKFDPPNNMMPSIIFPADITNPNSGGADFHYTDSTNSLNIEGYWEISAIYTLKTGQVLPTRPVFRWVFGT